MTVGGVPQDTPIADKSLRYIHYSPVHVGSGFQFPSAPQVAIAVVTPVDT